MQIRVECCVDCHLHNWCSRHNEAKYHQLYMKIEAKAKSLFPECSISKNDIPQNLSPFLPNNRILAQHKYFDSALQEIVFYPRHGAFEVTVNDVLIFSKISSKMWPNVQRIAELLICVNNEISKGGDANKFSFWNRMDHQSRVVEANKKQFKITKRPFSSTNNAVKGAFIQRKSQVKRNQLSLKKNTSGQYSRVTPQNDRFIQTYKEPDYCYELNQIDVKSPILKNIQKYSPRTKKRIEHKNLLNDFKVKGDGKKKLELFTGESPLAKKEQNGKPDLIINKRAWPPKKELEHDSYNNEQQKSPSSVKRQNNVKVADSHYEQERESWEKQKVIPRQSQPTAKPGLKKISMRNYHLQKETATENKQINNFAASNPQQIFQINPLKTQDKIISNKQVQQRRPKTVEMTRKQYGEKDEQKVSAIDKKIDIEIEQPVQQKNKTFLPVAVQSKHIEQDYNEFQEDIPAQAPKVQSHQTESKDSIHKNLKSSHKSIHENENYQEFFEQPAQPKTSKMSKAKTSKKQYQDFQEQIIQQPIKHQKFSSKKNISQQFLQQNIQELQFPQTNQQNNKQQNIPIIASEDIKSKQIVQQRQKNVQKNNHINHPSIPYQVAKDHNQSSVKQSQTFIEKQCLTQNNYKTSVKVIVNYAPSQNQITNLQKQDDNHYTHSRETKIQQHHSKKEEDSLKNQTQFKEELLQQIIPESIKEIKKQQLKQPIIVINQQLLQKQKELSLQEKIPCENLQILQAKKIQQESLNKNQAIIEEEVCIELNNKDKSKAEQNQSRKSQIQHKNIIQHPEQIVANDRTINDQQHKEKKQDLKNKLILSNQQNTEKIITENVTNQLSHVYDEIQSKNIQNSKQNAINIMIEKQKDKEIQQLSNKQEAKQDKNIQKMNNNNQKSHKEKKKQPITSEVEIIQKKQMHQQISDQVIQSKNNQRELQTKNIQIPFKRQIQITSVDQKANQAEVIIQHKDNNTIFQENNKSILQVIQDIKSSSQNCNIEINLNVEENVKQQTQTEKLIKTNVEQNLNEIYTNVQQKESEKNNKIRPQSRPMHEKVDKDQEEDSGEYVFEEADKIDVQNNEEDEHKLRFDAALEERNEEKIEEEERLNFRKQTKKRLSEKLQGQSRWVVSDVVEEDQKNQVNCTEEPLVLIEPKNDSLHQLLGTQQHPQKNDSLHQLLDTQQHPQKNDSVHQITPTNLEQIKQLQQIATNLQKVVQQQQHTVPQKMSQDQNLILHKQPSLLPLNQIKYIEKENEIHIVKNDFTTDQLKSIQQTAQQKNINSHEINNISEEQQNHSKKSQLLKCIQQTQSKPKLQTQIKDSSKENERVKQQQNHSKLQTIIKPQEKKQSQEQKSLHGKKQIDLEAQNMIQNTKNEQHYHVPTPQVQSIEKANDENNPKANLITTDHIIKQTTQNNLQHMYSKITERPQTVLLQASDAAHISNEMHPVLNQSQIPKTSQKDSINQIIQEEIIKNQQKQFNHIINQENSFSNKKSQIIIQHKIQNNNLQPPQACSNNKKAEDAEQINHRPLELRKLQENVIDNATIKNPSEEKQILKNDFHSQVSQEPVSHEQKQQHQEKKVEGIISVVQPNVQFQIKNQKFNDLLSDKSNPQNEQTFEKIEHQQLQSKNDSQHKVQEKISHQKLEHKIEQLSEPKGINQLHHQQQSKQNERIKDYESVLKKQQVNQNKAQH